MADNYLEKREEALRAAGRVIVRRNTPSLDTLLLKNRSHRAYDTSYRVAMRQLETIVSVNTKIPSGKNGQTLRFKLIDTSSGGADFCRSSILAVFFRNCIFQHPELNPRLSSLSAARSRRRLPWTSTSAFPSKAWP